ncbi:hypothetical protein GPECTOR_21g725 [Gonium pectorale]|uniref:Uncharacterized protein n=1 Tax=Gonium pectorale TaxID=33097 RepID=A0A150GI91_GONPE|nr:hypothetical protein GPECTOR_21g725 [Gonium pectorale]|eukprot:KXZ49499.1 hypothetical protein GPECTOR_21g725 [Gonium pectorale]
MATAMQHDQGLELGRLAGAHLGQATALQTRHIQETDAALDQANQQGDLWEALFGPMAVQRQWQQQQEMAHLLTLHAEELGALAVRFTMEDHDQRAFVEEVWGHLQPVLDASAMQALAKEAMGDVGISRYL